MVSGKQDNATNHTLKWNNAAQEWEHITDFSTVKVGDVVRIWVAEQQAFMTDVEGFDCLVIQYVGPNNEKGIYDTVIGMLPRYSRKVH